MSVVTSGRRGYDCQNSRLQGQKRAKEDLNRLPIRRGQNSPVCQRGPLEALPCSDFGTRRIRTGLPAKDWRNLVVNTLDVLASGGLIWVESALIYRQSPSLAKCKMLHRQQGFQSRRSVRPSSGLVPVGNRLLGMIGRIFADGNSALVTLNLELVRPRS